MLSTVVKSKKIAEIMEKGCVACGSCMNVCPRNAIKVPKGIYAVVDSNRCVGCGLCNKNCPASVIKITVRKAEHEEGFAA